MKVRADAEAREKRKRQGTTDEMRQNRERRYAAKRKRATGKRWLGRPRGAAGGLREGGQAPAGSSAAPLEVSARVARPPRAWICFEGHPNRNFEDVLIRRDFHLEFKWHAMTKKILAGKVKAENVIFAVTRLNGDAFAKNDMAIACCVLGGVLTSAQWLVDATRAKPPEHPEGIRYSGIQRDKKQHKTSGPLAIGVSAAMKEQRNQMCLFLKELAQKTRYKVVFAEEVDEVKASWARYVRARGTRSRPAGSHVVIAVDDADRKAVIARSDLTAGQEAMVQTLPAFLQKFSHASRAKCPGRWVFFQS